MNHCFEVEIAKEYGIEEAILINYFVFWIAKNKANNKHFYDGHTWTYNSVKAFEDLFPYINPSKIRRVIDGLIEKSVLLKGNYNKNPYDRTNWYAFSIDFERKFDLLKTANGLSELDKCITVTLPYTETNTEKADSKESAFQKALFVENTPENNKSEKEKSARAKAGNTRLKPEAPPEYSDFVRIWLESYPDLGFSSLDGKKIKSLITQTKAYLEAGGREPTKEATIAMFAYVVAYLKRDGGWYNGKDLSVIDSKYRTIIFEIKNGKQNTNSRQQRIDLTNDFIRSLPD